VTWNLTLPALPAGIDTPAIVVDLDVVERNVERMTVRMTERGIALRPHAKTHKSTRLAHLQLKAGASGITVGTLGEAEVMAAAGVDDIFIAYPLWPSGSKAARLRDLNDRVALAVGVDSFEGAAAIGAAVAGASRPLRVMIEVDSGERRTGVQAANAPRIAAAAEDAGLIAIGIFTHGGHGYAGPANRATAADDEVRALSEAADALRRRGREAGTISAGSTPTADLSARKPVTEERPGTYVFGDRQQLALGTVGPDEIGLFVAATVVSTAVDGQFIVDAGSKTLARDRPDFLAGHGLLPAWPNAVISRTYDYHGVVDVPDGRRPRVGDTVAIVPNHVCPVVNLADELLVVRSGQVVDRWPVDARGHTA
jgi:D-serine deaminase-like pyridoxal phosphate-dependent protein